MQIQPLNIGSTVTSKVRDSQNSCCPQGVLTPFSVLIPLSLLAALGLRLGMTRFNMIDLLNKR